MSTPQKIVSRQELKDLIDGMHEDELPAIKRYLQFLRYLDDPVARSLADAPLDDEDNAAEGHRCVPEDGMKTSEPETS